MFAKQKKLKSQIAKRPSLSQSKIPYNFRQECRRKIGVIFSQTKRSVDGFLRASGGLNGRKNTFCWSIGSTLVLETVADQWLEFKEIHDIPTKLKLNYLYNMVQLDTIIKLMTILKPLKIGYWLQTGKLD